MQVQSQTQQIDQTQQTAEEELFLPLSDDELETIAGGCIPYIRCRPNPLDIAQFGRKRASLKC
ncbi:MAG TPA: hypothetical protein V6C65_12915 [Allocoleopsis sp.]